MEKELSHETPDLLSSVQSSSGFIQQVQYSKQIAEILSNESSSDKPSKKSRIVVDSITSINGNLQKKISYEYVQKMHSNCQIIVSSAIIKEEANNKKGKKKRRRRRENKYNTRKKK